MQISDDLAQIEASPRAIVYLTVEWSMPEIESRKVFNELHERFRHENADVDVFVLQEDSPPVQQWLVNIGMPDRTPDSTWGAGSILWLESGKLRAWEINAGRDTAEQLHRRTAELWPS